MLIRLLLFCRKIVDSSLHRLGWRAPELDVLTESVAQDNTVDIEYVNSMNERLSGFLNRDTGDLFKDFAVGPNDKVLDVGCGNGRYLYFCARRGAHLTWVDVDQEKVEHMKAELQDSAAASLSGHVSDSKPLPFEQPFANRIIASEVLEHVEQPAEFLAELYRVGVPGARYLITVPHQRSEQMQQSIAPPEYFQKPNHINIFSETELEQLVVDAGFEIINQENTGFYQAVWWMLIWIAPGEGLSASRIQKSELMKSWITTWTELLNNPRGAEVKQILDNALPKRRVIVAQKPG